MSYESPLPPGPPPQGAPVYGPARSYYAPPPVIPRLAPQAYGHWGRRVQAALIDFAPTILGTVVFLIGYLILVQQQVSQLAGLGTGFRPSDFINAFLVVGYAIMVLAVPWNIYNRWLTGGRTGQSLGKRVAGLTLLSEQTGAPVGAGMAFLRDLTHVLDGAACYIGYLWPLWDEKRQTFADKLVQTVVLPARPAAPAPPG